MIRSGYGGCPYGFPWIYVFRGDRNHESGVEVDVDVQIRGDLVEFVVGNYLFGDASRMPGDADSLVAEGVIDSTGILELIEFLESRFAIEVLESETVPSNLDSIAALTSYVQGKQALREPSR